MLIKGALHVHSQASHDGKVSLPKIADLYRRRGFQFICIAEHSEDMTTRKITGLREKAEYLSSADFRIIVGIEYSCADALHIVGVGCEALLDTSDPVRLVQDIRSARCFSILAHPLRLCWRCSPELAASLDAVEVWNVRYDGKYLPSPPALEFFNRMKALNPKLLAAVGDDFHGLGGFYPLSICMSVNSLDRESILTELIGGRYQIGGPGFHTAATSSFSPTVLASFRALHIPLNCAKSLRDKLTQTNKVNELSA
jgi:hypothetical protein